MLVGTHYFYLIGMKLEFRGTIFEKYSYKISSSPSFRSRLLHADRQTDQITFRSS